MMKVFSGSLLYRFWCLLLFAWPNSLACKAGAVLQAAWQGSFLYGPLTRALGSDCTWTKESLFARLMTAVNRTLHNWAWIRNWVDGSLIVRLCRAILRVCENSRIVGWLFRGGVSRLLLLLLALYVPIDYLLRDVLPIPVLGSIWDELLLIVCTGWALWMKASAQIDLRARVTPMHVPLILFLLIALSEMFFVSPYFSIALSGYRATVQYMLWFFVICSLMRNDGDFFVVYVAMAVVGTVIGLHGIYQYIIGVPIPSSWMSSSEQSVRTRVFSIFGSPNIMGDFMVMMAPLGAGLLFYLKDWRLKFLALCATGIMCLSCLFTMSRGAWIGMAVAVLLFMAIIDRRLFLAALGAVVCALFLPFVWSRVSYLFSPEYRYLTTNGGRESRWALGISYLYRTNPLLGMGLGMWGGAVAMQNKQLHWVWYTYVDHYYLRIFIEMGWVGILSFAGLMILLAVTGIRVCYRLHEKREKALAAGLLAGLAGVMAHCFFENIFEEPYMMAVFWILAGLLAWIGFLRKPTENT